MIFDGDSLTVGVGSDGTNTYPALSTSDLPPYVAVNMGRSGSTLAQMNADAATRIDPLLVTTNERVAVVVAWGGSNDLQAGASAATIYARAKQYAQDRKAAGWKVVLLTITSRGAGTDTVRLAANALLRADFPTATAYANVLTGASYADYLADVASDPTIIANYGNATYFADGVHFTSAGYALIATYARQAISLLYP